MSQNSSSVLITFITQHTIRESTCANAFRDTKPPPLLPLNITMIMSDVLLHTFIVTQMSSKEQLTFFPVINNVTVLFSLNVCIHTDVFLYWMKCKCDNMTTATGVENLVLYVLLSSVLSRSSLADSTHFPAGELKIKHCRKFSWRIDLCFERLKSPGCLSLLLTVLDRGRRPADHEADEGWWSGPLPASLEVAAIHQVYDPRRRIPPWSDSVVCCPSTNPPCLWSLAPAAAADKILCHT